ncbi:hypothetical protein, partial [Oscillibacter sp.]|uniref:hypothetical protein n=1 Tax=Oscillibacter sp. TaxID=1945593 RepID=UPI002897446B
FYPEFSWIWGLTFVSRTPLIFGFSLPLMQLLTEISIERSPANKIGQRSSFTCSVSLTLSETQSYQRFHQIGMRRRDAGPGQVLRKARQRHRIAQGGPVAFLAFFKSETW